MTQKEELRAAEKHKERMIHEYMKLQDQADALNEDIYKVCCGIETLNAQITILKEQIQRAALKTLAPANGVSKAPPAS